jgi:hypothetical protein
MKELCETSKAVKAASQPQEYRDVYEAPYVRAQPLHEAVRGGNFGEGDESAFPSVDVPSG